MTLRPHNRAPRTDWTGWAPPSPELRSIRHLFRRHRRASVGAYLLIVVVGAYGFYDAQRARTVECRHANETRAALVTIIERGDSNLAALVKEGTITKAQAARSLGQSRRARQLLAPYSCEEPPSSTGDASRLEGAKPPAGP